MLLQPPLPPYEMGNTHNSQINSDVELNFHVGDKAIQIGLFTANFEASPTLKREYLLHVKQSDPEYILPSSENPEHFGDDYDGVDDPREDCLYPKRLMYILQGTGDKLIPAPLPKGVLGMLCAAKSI
jgi:hypothetical protein